MGRKPASAAANLESIREVFAAALKVPPSRVDASTSMDTLRQWDSLAHLGLMTALERKFGVRFANAELRGLTSVAAILACLRAKEA